MTEIPSDVMKAAREATATFYETQGEKDSASVIRAGRKDCWWWMQVIARAILAERERCAKVAEKRAQEYDDAYEETEFKAHSMGGSAALIAIASRIRSGS